MTAKEYLSQAYHLDQRINSKLAQIAVLRSLTQQMTASFNSVRVSQTRNVSSLEDTILRLMEAEKELNQSVNTLISIKIEIVEAIARIDNLDCALLLEKRYLCYQSWEVIAADLKCTVRWVHILHAKAIQSMNRLLQEKEKGAATA